MADIEQGVGRFGRQVCSGFRSMGSWVLVLFNRALYWLLFGIISVVLVSLFAVSGILAPLYYMVTLSFGKKWEVGDEEDTQRISSWLSVADIYKRWKSAEETSSISKGLSVRYFAKCGLLFLLWLLLNVSVPRLKALTLLGSPLWRWSLLPVVLTSSYFVAIFLYHVLKFSLNLLVEAHEIISYFLISTPGAALYLVLDVQHGILQHAWIPSANFTIYSGIVLVLWLFYFRTEAGLRHVSTPHPKAFEYVTWTCVSLFVGSILMFLKTTFLTKWSDNAIYGRFQPKILITSAKFVYLRFFIAGIYKLNVPGEFFFLGRGLELNCTSRIMSRQVSMHHLRNIGRNLASLAKMVKPLQEDGVPQLLSFLGNHDFFRAAQMSEPADNEEEQKLVQLHGPLGTVFQLFAPPIGRHREYFGRSRDDALDITYALLNLLREQTATASEDSQLTRDDLKIWLVDSHKNCVNLGRTLDDANAIVTRLDVLLSFIIFIIVVLLWILITGIATTTILVTIATPLITLTFIFGDSTKQFFQGIIFCFGTHAFDVGDRCIIDNTELEVKNMDILTTTFNKIGTPEKRFYPNSVLATKEIINLGWQPDPSDTVEVTLDYFTTRTQWQMFEKKVERFFNHPQQKEFFHSWHELVMKESGDKIKLIIRFKHVLKVNEITHGECLQKKNRHRSKILNELNYFLGHTSPPTTDGQVTNFKHCYLRSKSEDFHNRKTQSARLNRHWSC